MNRYEWIETVVFFAVLLAAVKPVGGYMAKVFQGEKTLLSPVLVPIENMIYKVCGTSKEEETG
ncbi:potassium-transporting ATPase subunit KdpA, partial [Geomonas sp. Red32]|uniref:potassium-transporting ATPase subunit KdpA n=1 Tax=Geomonas sp. Red32 TaxID=2912856 RepID=UPI00202CEF8C